MKKLLALAGFSFLAIILSKSALATELQKLPSDPEFRQQVVGTWIVDMPPIKGTVTIIAGGRFFSQGEINLANDTIEIRYEGAWRIDSGILIEEIMKSNTELLPVGHVTRDKIIRVNDQELVFQTEAGKTVTRKRSH
jgi:hypothetical protein